MYDPMLHPDPAINGADWQSYMFRDFEVNEAGTQVSWLQLTGVVYYDVFAFESAESDEPVATARIPQVNNYNAASALNDEVTFNLSELNLPGGTYYIAIQGIVPRAPVNVGGIDVYWGVDSPVSNRIPVVIGDTDPLAGADGWALVELAEAIEAGLVDARMVGNWTAAPTRVQAAADIVRFALVFTGAEDLDELYEILDLEEVDPWADTLDANARFLRAAGISEGVGEGNFDPTGSFTRAAMVVMIYRLAMALDLDVDGYPLASESFDDVPDWPQHEEAIGWAYAVGITTGIGNRQFNPLGELQNQHVGVFAIRALNNLSLDAPAD